LTHVLSNEDTHPDTPAQATQSDLPCQIYPDRAIIHFEKSDSMPESDGLKHSWRVEAASEIAFLGKKQGFWARSSF
jgi:hypothetical protein